MYNKQSNPVILEKSFKETKILVGSQSMLLSRYLIIWLKKMGTVTPPVILCQANSIAFAIYLETSFFKGKINV